MRDSYDVPVWEAAAAERYLVARAAGQDIEAALGTTAAAEHLKLREVSQLWRAQHWELAFRAAANAQILISDAVRPDLMLESLVRRHAELEAQLVTAHDLATMPIPPFTPSQAREVQLAAESLQSAMLQYHRLMGDLDAVQERITQQQERMVLDHAVTSSQPDWAARKREIRGELHAAYRGRGPQYDLLVEELTSHKLLIEQVRAAPVPLNPTEYQRLSRIVLDYTNQLQKYTEAQKTEVIKEEVIAAVEQTLAIIEQHVAPSHPTLWHEIVEDVVHRLGGQVIEHDDHYVLAAPEG